MVYVYAECHSCLRDSRYMCILSVTAIIVIHVVMGESSLKTPCSDLAKESVKVHPSEIPSLVDSGLDANSNLLSMI